MSTEAPEDDLDFSSLYGHPFTPHSFHYGPHLSVIPASRAGKAHTLLADAVFNSSLLMCEWIDQGFLNFCHGRSVLELGAGTALPSLHLLQTPTARPSQAVITDYPSADIMLPLHENVSSNTSPSKISSEPKVITRGLDWANSDEIEQVRTLQDRGFDVIIAADLLWYTDAHPQLLNVIKRLLAVPSSSDGFEPRVLIATGRYVKPAQLSSFFSLASQAGFKWRELDLDSPFSGSADPGWGEMRLDDRKREWRGTHEVWWQDDGGQKMKLDVDELGVRKDAVWTFDMRWNDDVVMLKDSTTS
ncbi:hypothetical protein BT69DRAFT_362168 [Atractiella rhizophila]|nr:hypothetical protein BT69DRAFT_362168 [Atractiella rhizophila]